MKAKKQEIKRWGAAEIGAEEKSIGLDGSPTQVVRIFSPPARSGGRVFTGDAAAMVDQLVGEMEKGKLI